jgi:hypothetical protein
MVDDADDVAEGFGVPQMVNHFVDVFRPRRCPPARCHRLGHLLDARLTGRTAERAYPRLDLRTQMRLCYAAVLGGYQQSQQKINTNLGGEWNDRSSSTSAAFRAARFARIVSAMVGGRFSSSLSPSGRVPKMCLSQRRHEINRESNK